ncbi:hypothetical protein [Anaeromyxobacter oryzae]|uniref:DUF4340 domain-containing protein n=1 Tax=Anaeromyxobacter oryzae TaxID=2918170 RepID=A0ABN6MNB4_9BACT|nr:hypothetical protein [Anaeromyxobacter oryzae]BDG02465.1 hypothetical protein AMOR_14610 [Anaeromyxobacter oryzae]
MRSRAVLVGILVALLPAAAAITWFARHVRSREIASGVHRGSEVAALDPARVVRLRVEVRGRSVTAVRSPDGWRGEGTVVSGPQVDAVLARLAALRRRGTLARVDALREELGAYGLVRPRARVEATLDDGRALAWAVGEETGRDGAAFLLAPDETVVIAAQEPVAALEAALAALAGTAIPPASRMDVPDIRTPAPASSGSRR